MTGVGEYASKNGDESKLKGRETDPDLAIQPLLKFLKLLFLITLNSLSLSGQESITERHSEGARTFNSLDDCLIA